MQTDRQTDMTKQWVTFYNFATAPKNQEKLITKHFYQLKQNMNHCIDGMSQTKGKFCTSLRTHRLKAEAHLRRSSTDMWIWSWEMWLLWITNLIVKFQRRLRHASHKAVFYLFPWLHFVVIKCSHAAIPVQTVCKFSTGIHSVCFQY